MREPFVCLAVCAFLAAMLAPAGDAGAQKLARDSLFNRGSLEDLLKESKERHRFLIIFYVGANMSASDKRAVEMMRDRTFRSASVGLWLQWHATLTEVNQAERPKQFALLRNALNSSTGTRGNFGGGGFSYGSPPRILVFKDGWLVRVLPDPSQDGEKYKGAWRGGGSESKFVSPTGFLLRLDMLMDGLTSTDPIWLEAHNLDNPPPEAPARKYWSRVEDENAPAIEDPPAPEGEPVDVLAVLDEARTAKRARQLFDATGLYTWLWERGAELDPAFEAARLSIIAYEIGDLSAARKSARTRFGNVFDETINRGLWVEWPERFAWMMLGSRIGRMDDFVEVLDVLIQDFDEGAVTPREERAINQEIIRHDPTADPWRLPRNGTAPIVRALEGGPAMTQKGTGKTFEELKATRRWIARMEACRAYAACLKAGRDGDAAAIAEGVIADANDGACRVALVMTALAFGQARGAHLAMLDDAAARGVNRPTLRRHVAEQLEKLAPVAPQPVSGGTPNAPAESK